SRRRRRPRRIVLRNCLPCPLSPPNRRCAMITRPSPQQKGFSMPRTRFALLSAVALLLSFPAATAFAAGAKAPAPPAKAAVAPPIPGVGYDPQVRGLSVSIYQLDTLTTPLQRYSAVFAAA